MAMLENMAKKKPVSSQKCTVKGVEVTFPSCRMGYSKQKKNNTLKERNQT